MAESTAAELPEGPPPLNPTSICYLHPRRESFEHGLLPIPKLIFSDGVQTLSHIKSSLLSSSTNDRVNSEIVSQVLQIPIEHSRLLIETLSAILHDESDSLLTAKTSEDIDRIGANVFDLLLLLYIQSYKRLLPKGHKDSAAVADVWPSTSAFDGFLSALSPLQLVRSNSRRFMPSQADEEAHQLSYLQKHMANILALLADSTDADNDDSLVLSMDNIEHLGLLVYFGERGSQKTPLRQSTPFFANSDPDMPAVPVSATQVLDWLLQCISYSLDHIADRASLKENGPTTSSDQDVTMTDVTATSLKTSRGPCLIEGISKSSYVKQATDFKGSSVKVVNCHDSVIYILAPLKFVTIYGCSDATVVLGAVGKAIRVEHCERVHVIATARRVCIANCRECVFFLGVNQQPLTVGDNHKLQVAPYNTFYSQLEDHMIQAGVDSDINRWDEPVALGVVDPHDSLSHPAGASDVLTESATRLDPDHYANFLIPNWMGTEGSGSTKDNPFALPDSYLASQQKKLQNLVEVKQILRETQVDDARKRELSVALHTCFKDWLYVSGNIRQLFGVHGE